jgi:hypothetical protein
MADDFRSQINSARRAGYSDAEIIDHLKQTDTEISDALKEGYAPEEILTHIAPPLNLAESGIRGAAITLRAAAPSVLGAAAGATLGAFGGPAAPITVPAGALIGSLGVPISDAVISAYNALANKNVKPTSEVIKNWLGGPKPETTKERILDVASGAMTPAGVESSAAGLVKTLPGLLGRTGVELARAPINQLVTAPASAAVTQGVTEKSDNPLLGAAAGLVTGSVASLRPRVRQTAPSVDELAVRAKANYDILDQSNFQLHDAPFDANFQNIETKLTNNFAYDPALEPSVKNAIDRLKAGNPKNAVELQTIRTFINKARQSTNASERKIASELLDTFDDYVLTAPVGGDAKALAAWKDARADYSKMKKGEIFSDIIEKAELSQGDKGKSIASQLSSLAKNDKKMRLFTPIEQDQIKLAAKGGPIQSLLNTAAKFTPMTPAAAIFTAVNPWGAYTAAGGMASKAAATSMQERGVNRLSAQMRSGTGGPLPILEGATRNVPLSIYRQSTNALSTQQQNQNALANQ